MKRMAVSVAALPQFCSPALPLSPPPPPSPPSASPPVSSPPPHLRSCSCHLHACPRTWHEIVICFSNSLTLACSLRLSSPPSHPASAPCEGSFPIEPGEAVSIRIDLFKVKVKDLKWPQDFFHNNFLNLCKTILIYSA